MKTILTVSILLLLYPYASSQDFPPASPNIQTAPAGTLIIGMDNTTQATRRINAATGTYLFNVKAYGMVVRLLNDEVLVNWIIKTGKAKDEADFSVTAEKVAPEYQAAQNYDFKAGPFLIFPADTLGVMEIIDYINGRTTDSARVSVYRTTQDVDVDVRYTLLNPPRVAILDYISQCDLHSNYMYAANVPWVNWECTISATVLRSGCFSIVTVPHTDPNLLDQVENDSITSFVYSGGNFLAQCESVYTFETADLFQVDDGLLYEPANGGNQNGFNQNVYYDNPDMAMSQFEGDIKPRLRGAFQRWRFTGNPVNNFYSVVSCRKTPGDDLYYTATVSKHYSGIGGVAFYIGNHEFYTSDSCGCAGFVAADIEKEVNGLRMYLNAILVPATLTPCIPLEVKLVDFNANKQHNGAVLVSWQTGFEKDNDYFHVEHSTDGTHFNQIGKIKSKGDSPDGFSYSFTHQMPASGINYYRLRVKGTDGKVLYSEIRTVVFGNNSFKLAVYPNPASGLVYLQLDKRDGTPLQISVFDATSRLMRSGSAVVMNQRATMDLKQLKNGIYFITAVTADGEQYKSKLVINR